jgi:hypothetical protein
VLRPAGRRLCERHSACRKSLRNARSGAPAAPLDFGRKRDLHIANAVAVADAGPADVCLKTRRLTDERTLLVSKPHFVLERIELAPGSAIRLDVDRETWVLVVSGSACAASFDIATGDAVFAQSDNVDIHAGLEGMASLVAYTGIGGLIPHLPQSIAQPSVVDATPLEGNQMTSPSFAKKAAQVHRPGGATL